MFGASKVLKKTIPAVLDHANSIHPGDDADAVAARERFAAWVKDEGGLVLLALSYETAVKQPEEQAEFVTRASTV